MQGVGSSVTTTKKWLGIKDRNLNFNYKIKQKLKNSRNIWYNYRRDEQYLIFYLGLILLFFRSRGVVKLKILNIKIHNFRGLDIECNGLDDKTLFIGQNDSGKSNICSAILKVFTLVKRRKALVSSDSTFGNNMDIEFSFKLDLEGLSREQLGLLQD